MSRLPLYVLASAVLVLPLSQIDQGSSSETRPIPESHQSTAKAGGLELRNSGTQPVRVELGVAYDGDCAGRARLVRALTVPAGHSWFVRSSQPICVRQEKLEGDGQIRMQAWERKQPVAGQVEEVIL